LVADGNKIGNSDLKQIFEVYYEALVKYAYRFVLVKDECEDLVQDVFVSLWEKENVFPNELSLKVYLFKAVRN
jgi:RNA polymerase sigma factor (sigma-70 family)